MKPHLLKMLLIVWALASSSALGSPVYAQTASVPSQPVEQQEPVDPATWAPILENAGRAVERQRITERELDQIMAETNTIRDEATRQIGLLQPRFDEISQQLTQLGEAPAEGQPEESSEARKQRETLNSQFAEIDAKLKAVRLALLQSQQIQRSVVQARQSKFFRSITVRSKGIFTTGFWSDFVGNLGGYVRSLNLLVVDGFEIAVKELGRQPWKIGVIPMFLIAATYLFVRTRRFLIAKIAREDAEDGVTDTARLYRSRFLEFCRNGLLPALYIFVVYRILWDGFLLTPRLGDLLAGVAAIASLYIMVLVLLRIIVSPREGRARLLLVNDYAARRIVRVLSVGLGVAALLAILNAIAIVVISGLAISVGLSFLFTLSVAFTFMRAMWILHRDRVQHEELQSLVPHTKTWTLIKLVVQLVTIAIFLTAIFGYVALSEFLAQQLVFGLVVIGTVWLILRFVHNIAAPAIELASGQASYAEGGASPQEAKTGQLAILATGFVTLVLYLAASILLLLPWGYRTSDFYQVVESVFFGFEIGGLRISISTVLMVVALFFIGYTVTVSLRNWLNTKFLPTTALDVGLSNSISTVFGYIGFILAAVMAISVAGFDLSNLAIVAGALSVGVGFGLQSIVNNFVSGLILLAERPIKAGDWIVTTGGEGTVTKISVRSTEIQTFDRATVIIPNSTLITDNVTNWTHESKTGRVIVRIGVSYDSDVEKVREILLDIAKKHRLILGRPAPEVFFMDFGASSLDFELRCFLADITYTLVVQSELRFSILAALREAGIEIPFPQTDLHIRSGLPTGDAAAKL